MNKPITQLWSCLSISRKKQLVLLFLLTLFASIAEVGSIGAVLPLLGALTKPELLYEQELLQPLIRVMKINSPGDILLPLTVLFILTVCITALIRILLLVLQTRLAHAIGADLSVEIFQRTLYQPYHVHISRNSSEIIAGVSSKVNQVVYLGLVPLLTMASSIIILSIILTALIAIESLIVMSALAGLGMVYLLITLATRDRLASNSLVVSQNSELVIKVLQEALGGIREVLIDGTQRVYCKIYREADIAFRNAQANNQILGASPRFIIEAMGMSLIAILAFIFTLREKELGMSQTIPLLGAVALGAQRLLPILQQLYQAWSSLKGVEQILQDVLNLIRQPLPNIDRSKTEPIKFQESIVLNNVGYCYSLNGPLVFSNLSLKIKKGDRIGIIGTTGSGKSTLLDILMGLLLPSTGRLEIDGLPISSENYSGWRAHIAHVPQNIFLADASIAENIAFGVPFDQIDIERVRLAAEKAQISGLIESWKLKYKTMVGERGVRLSGGERQRIGIARALYKPVDVIIFDEATSALDTETESRVMNTINTIDRNITLIIVAHRLSTLAGCDFIYQVSRGNLEISEAHYLLGSQ